MPAETVEINKAIVRRYFDEIWNSGNMEAAGEVLAANFSACGGAISGLEAARLYISSYREAYPHTHFTILSILAEEDFVSVCWACSGAHGGSAGNATGLSVYRLADGKIIEAWATSDVLGPMQRLGISRKA
jgi:predicted SnoaL-like aldol condensation-catalyzing enzyme